MKNLETSGMHNETGVPRPTPTGPYSLGPERLNVSEQALELTLQVLRHAGRLETCCFWYGTRGRAGSLDVVTAVVIPRQRQTWGNYHVTADAMQRIHRRVSPTGLRNLAQVHSHPGADVEHSEYDDRMANSRCALSIVVPFYGQWRATWPHGIGVHEFQQDYWHLLTLQEASCRVVRQAESKVDLFDCR